MSTARAWALLALLALALAACGESAPPIPADLPANVAPRSAIAGPAGAATLLAGDAAPDFSFQTLDGRTTRLSELRGKVVIVNFWATWCGPCRAEMPALQRLADQQGQRVVVLGVNKLEEPAMIGPFARELGLRFLLIANPKGDISDAYGVRNLPTTFFITPDGVVGDWKLGGVSYEDALATLDRLSPP